MQTTFRSLDGYEAKAAAFAPTALSCHRTSYRTMCVVTNSLTQTVTTRPRARTTPSPHTQRPYKEPHMLTTAQQLRTLPKLARQLPDTLTPPKTRQPTGTSPIHSPAPLNLETLRLLDQRTRYNWLNDMTQCDPDRMGIQPYLHAWVLDLEATLLDNNQTPNPTPTHPTIQATCTWLLQHLHAIQQLPQWEAFAHGIQCIYSACRNVLAPIDKTPPPDPICNQCHTGHLRPTTTDQETSNNDESNNEQWKCDECGRHATIHLVTLPEAAQQLNIGTGTLYRWANTNRFHRIQINGIWHYDLLQLSAEVAKHRLNSPKPHPEQPNTPNPT